MATVLRPDESEPVRPETCDWGFFSGSHCGDVSVWGFGESFSVCGMHHKHLMEIHSRIPQFSRRFYRAC